MTPETVDKIRDFVAREAEAPFEEILPGTRLFADLHVDGPRAVVFMERFSSRFNVDVEDLWVRWDDYFSTEGITVKGFMLALFLGAAAVATLSFALPGLSMWLTSAIGMGILLMASLLFLRGSRSRGDRREITVGELVNAVKAERLRLR